MRIYFPKSRAASPGALLFALILVFSINARRKLPPPEIKLNQKRRRHRAWKRNSSSTFSMISARFGPPLFVCTGATRNG